MSDTPQTPPPRGTETALDRIDALADAFEREWRLGARPRVADFLVRVSASDRPALLEELVRLDLEYRLRAGEPARVEEVLAEYPLLADCRALVIDLIALEHRVRGGSSSDYLRRFPSYTDELAGRLGSSLPPRIPGYELLEELGRGGMGVVWKARQAGLGRAVALKMIPGRGLAGSEERARFRREAEAIARLSNPGVVQVFEVGEHDGVPYMALEYCPGGSLEKVLAGGPLRPRDAADLVGALAEATQAAHAVGVLHRDLKPANVLLAHPISREAAGGHWGGTAKLADFGLAKTAGEAGQTPSGAILGTPSYMAPEQTKGVRGVGPPADVYALGAVLYECLTGRPPFRAATSYETLILVNEAEPATPRMLQPGVPRDLETICLKCLEKLPARRYATPGELADDLRRFSEGKPILARPISAAGRAVRWARRSPAQAALVAIAAAAAVLAVAASVGYTRSLRAEMARAEAEKERNEAVFRQAEVLNGLVAYRLPQMAAAFRATGQLDKMKEAYADAVAVLRGACEMMPSSAVYHGNLGQSLYNLALATTATSHDEATRLYGEAIEALGVALVLEWPAHLASEDRRAYHLRNCHRNRAGVHTSRGRYQEALADWDRAIELTHDKSGPVLRLDRARTRALAGDHRQAAADVEALAPAFAADGKRLVNAASVAGRAALVAKDETLAQRYAGQAMILLERARALGAFREGSLRKVLTGKDFDVVRRQPGFHRLTGPPGRQS